MEKTDEFVSKTYAESNFVSLSNTYSKTEIDGLLPDLSTYATEDWVNSKVLDLLTGSGSVSIDLSNYYTRAQVQDEITDALSEFDGGSGGSFDTTLYYTKLDTQTYLATELNSYYNKQSIDGLFDSYYTRTQVDNLLSEISTAEIDMSNYYTKDVADLKMQYTVDQNLPDMTLYYNKLEMDNLLNNVSVDLTSYYTKTEIDTLLENFDGGTGGSIDSTVLEDYYTKTQTDDKFLTVESIDWARATNVYSKAESDVLFVTEDDVVGIKFDITANTELINTSIDTVNENITNVTGELNTVKETLDTIDTEKINLDIYKVKEKITRLQDKLNNYTPKLVENDIITVTDPEVKTYSSQYNPEYVQVFLNRNLLYKDEYIATDGQTISLTIELLVNDKIKVITNNAQFEVDFTDIDTITTLPTV
jgi:hypothetical protein